MAKNFKCWPQGWPRSLDYPDLPVFWTMDQSAARVPNRLAAVFGGMELTFAELLQLCNRFARALASLGVSKGDRVAIHLPNCPQFVIAYYGALKAGAVFTPVSPLLSPREVTHQLNDSGAETLVTLDLLFPGIQDILPRTPVKRIISTSIADCYNAVIAPVKPLGKLPVPGTLDMPELLKSHPPEPPQVSITPSSDLAHLAYTGGTTGESKGVMLTHRQVVANALQFGNWFSGAKVVNQPDGRVDMEYPEGVSPERDRPLARDHETLLVVVPWFHAMGTVGYLVNPVGTGTTMIVFPRFDPREYLDAVAKYKATSLGGAPQLFVPLVELPDFSGQGLSGIKLAVSGAAPLPRAVLDKMLSAFSGVVCEAYGLTESSMGATANPPDRNAIKPGSVGLPVFDTEVKIVDVNTGAELAGGQEGEILVSGPQVMLGYWNRPEDTAGVLRDGWLHTGDIGRMDGDGFLFITDRKKDLILYKGYNVYPREIEEVLYTHPAVQTCAVVGRPDAKGGEAPVAFVQLRADATATDQDILNFANARLAAYKKIREVVFVRQMPISGAGKVLKRELKDKYIEKHP